MSGMVILPKILGEQVSLSRLRSWVSSVVTLPKIPGE